MIAASVASSAVSPVRGLVRIAPVRVGSPNPGAVRARLSAFSDVRA